MRSFTLLMSCRVLLASKDALHRIISPFSQQLERRSSVQEPQSRLSSLARQLRSGLNYAAGVLLALNLIFMCLELELYGRATAQLHGLLSEAHDMEDLNPVLRSLDIVFDCFYIVELMLRIGLHGRAFLGACANWFDMALVAVSTFDIGLFLFAADHGTGPMLLAVRALSTLRAIRLLRIFRLFRGIWACTS